MQWIYDVGLETVVVVVVVVTRMKQTASAYGYCFRTPIGSRDPFSPFPGKLGSPFYTRKSSRQNCLKLYTVEGKRIDVKRCIRGR